MQVTEAICADLEVIAARDERVIERIVRPTQSDDEQRSAGQSGLDIRELIPHGRGRSVEGMHPAQGMQGDAWRAPGHGAPAAARWS